MSTRAPERTAPPGALDSMQSPPTRAELPARGLRVAGPVRPRSPLMPPLEPAASASRARGFRPNRRAVAVLAPAAALLGLIGFGCNKPETSSGSLTDGASPATRVDVAPLASSASATAPPSTTSAPSTSSTAGSGAPAWLAEARGAPLYGGLAQNARLGPGRRPATLAAVDASLDEVARTPSTAIGLRDAAGILERARTTTFDPNWTGSGTSPAGALLHHGGMALLVVHAAVACSGSKGDAAVGRAAAEIPLPPMFGSGGPDKNAVEQDRHVLLEATRACGSKPD